MSRNFRQKSIRSEINELISDGWDYKNASRIAKRKAKKRYWEDHVEPLPEYLIGDCYDS